MTEQEQKIFVDLILMLDHYIEGRPDNWDGSTRSQAKSVLRDAKKIIQNTN